MTRMLVLLVFAACEPEPQPVAATPAAAADGAQGDTVPVPVPPPVVVAPAVPRPQPATDASLPELAALGALLDVPVQGVTRAELRDSYSEPRSGGRVHQALDIPATRGTPVLAASDGRLLKLFNSRLGGLMVYTTDVSERFILFYGHLDGYAEGMTEGMRLQRGQVIGYVGTTGNAPPGTPHLHFGIMRGRPDVSWSKGEPVNPHVLLTGQKL